MQRLEVSAAVRHIYMSLGFKRLRQVSLCNIVILLVGRDVRIKDFNVGRFQPFIGHKGPQGEQRYSSTLFLTSALEVGEGSASRPGRILPPGKDPVHVVQEAGDFKVKGHKINTCIIFLRQSKPKIQMRQFIQADTEIACVCSCMRTRIRTNNRTQRHKTHRRTSI